MRERTVCEEALRRPVPSGGDVLREGRLRGVYQRECIIWPSRVHASHEQPSPHLGMHPATAAKVCQAQAVVRDQNVLWLDVAVEDAVAVHVRERLQQLEHQPLQRLLAQPAGAALDQLLQVLLHQLEHQR